MGNAFIYKSLIDENNVNAAPVYTIQYNSATSFNPTFYDFQKPVSTEPIVFI